MNLFQHSLVLAVRVYRWTISPAQLYLFGAGHGCRFTPTCSVYASEAIATHGGLAGGWLAMKRLGRCHPWGGCGCDPVPPAREARALQDHSQLLALARPQDRSEAGSTRSPNFHG